MIESQKKLTRREFLRSAVVFTAAIMATACTQPSPHAVTSKDKEERGEIIPLQENPTIYYCTNFTGDIIEQTESDGTIIKPDFLNILANHISGSTHQQCSRVIATGKTIKESGIFSAEVLNTFGISSTSRLPYILDLNAEAAIAFEQFTRVASLIIPKMVVAGATLTIVIGLTQMSAVAALNEAECSNTRALSRYFGTMSHSNPMDSALPNSDTSSCLAALSNQARHVNEADGKVMQYRIDKRLAEERRDGIKEETRELLEVGPKDGASSPPTLADRYGNSEAVMDVVELDSKYYEQLAGNGISPGQKVGNVIVRSTYNMPVQEIHGSYDVVRYQRPDPIYDGGSPAIRSVNLDYVARTGDQSPLRSASQRLTQEIARDPGRLGEVSLKKSIFEAMARLTKPNGVAEVVTENKFNAQLAATTFDAYGTVLVEHKTGSEWVITLVKLFLGY